MHIWSMWSSIIVWMVEMTINGNQLKVYTFLYEIIHINVIRPFFKTRNSSNDFFFVFWYIDVENTHHVYWQIVATKNACRQTQIDGRYAHRCKALTWITKCRNIHTHQYFDPSYALITLLHRFYLLRLFCFVVIVGRLGYIFTKHAFKLLRLKPNYAKFYLNRRWPAKMRNGLRTALNQHKNTFRWWILNDNFSILI